MSSLKKQRIEERRELVKQLVVRGLNNLEIVRALKTKRIDVNEITVRRDLRVIRKGIIKEVKKEPIEDLLFKMSLQFKAIIREAWGLYYDSTTPERVKPRLLITVLNTIEKESKILFNLGIVNENKNLEDREIVVSWVKPDWKENGKNSPENHENSID